MAAQALFQRFIEKSPVTVMLRSVLEWTFSPAAIDAIFADARVRQVEGELLFSSVVDLLAAVVWRQKNSIGEAYRHAHEKFEVSVRSVYNKLNGTEMSVCRQLVRRPAEQLAQVAGALHRRPPLLKGYRPRILDGNHLTSTEHRLKPLRTTRSGPLPGQTLAVLDPDRMLIVDLICCEDGEAQERRLLPEVIETAKKDDLWIGDRNFCTTGFLFGLERQGATFVIRQHKSTLRWEHETKPEKVGRSETGVIYRRKLHLQQGNEVLVVRRITIVLDQPTASGETEIHLLTNLPARDAKEYKVAEIYLKRWSIENAFQEIEQALRSEIDTLGYPGAAVLGFAIAVMTYNVLSLVKWAIECEHAAVITREELSGYYLASIVSSDYGGMLIALPEEEWTRRFAALSCRAMATRLRECAKHVRPETYRKNVRGPQRPRPKRTSGTINHHVSTAQLLAQSK